MESKWKNYNTQGVQSYACRRWQKLTRQRVRTLIIIYTCNVIWEIHRIWKRDCEEISISCACSRRTISGKSASCWLSTATTTTTTTNVKQSSKTHRLVTSHQKPPFHQGANIGFKASKMMKHKTTSHKRPASGAKFCPSNCFFGLVETCHERRSYS